MSNDITTNWRVALYVQNIYTSTPFKSNNFFQSNLDREDEDALKADPDGRAAIRDAFHALEDTRAASSFSHLPICKAADRLNSAVMAAERREAERSEREREVCPADYSLKLHSSNVTFQAAKDQTETRPRGRPKGAVSCSSLYLLLFLLNYCLAHRSSQRHQGQVGQS
jgi:hypothetical protein